MFNLGNFLGGIGNAVGNFFHPQQRPQQRPQPAPHYDLGQFLNQHIAQPVMQTEQRVVRNINPVIRSINNRPINNFVGGLGNTANATSRMVGGTALGIGKGLVDSAVNAGRTVAAIPEYEAKSLYHLAKGDVAGAARAQQNSYLTKQYGSNYAGDTHGLGNAAAFGLDMLGAKGGGSLVKQGVKQGIGKVALKGAAQGAGFGGAYGVAQSAQQNNLSPSNMAHNIVGGALAGAAAGAAAPVVGHAVGTALKPVANAVFKGSQAAMDALKRANKAVGQEGFLAIAPPKITKPINPALPDHVKVQINDAQEAIGQLHQNIAQHQNEIAYAKENLEGNTKLTQAQKDKAIREIADHSAKQVALAKQEQAHWMDRIKQLDPSGQSIPVKLNEAEGVPAGEVTQLQEQIAEDTKPTLGEKIGMKVRSALGKDTPPLSAPQIKIGGSPLDLLKSEQGSVSLDPVGAFKDEPKPTLSEMAQAELKKSEPKSLGEQIGRLKAAIAKETDPNVQAELAAQLRELNQRFSASKAPAAELPDKGNGMDAGARAAEAARSADQATADAINEQRKAPTPIKLPEVQEGDAKQAILNSRAVVNMVRERANVAIEAARKLSKNDHALLDDLRTQSPEELSKRAENPKAFLAAAKAAKEYNDYTHALGTGQGQAINYRENYGASTQWDLSDKQTAEILDRYQAKLRETPGYSKQRLIPDYQTGERLGMKRLNPDFATDLATDAAKRERDISELALAKGLEQAFPGQVAIGEIPRGYTALQIAHGKAISLPTELADELNKRGTAPTVKNPVLKAYDATNRGLKYLSLGGGTFHALTTAGTTMGHQLADAAMHPTTIPGKLADNLKLVAGTFSDKAYSHVTKAWASNGGVHADGLSTLDRAHIAGVTLRPDDILGDANVRLMNKVERSRLNFISQIHTMVFGRQIPQAKQMIFEQATKGLDSRNPADLEKMRQVASAVNNFGGVNRAIEGLTPRDAQNLSRFVLATDFTETKFRKLADALTKKGPQGTMARQMVIGKALTFALPGLVTAAASGVLKTPEDFAAEMVKQLLDPSVQTNIDDQKNGGKKVAKLPSTEVSELGRIFLPIFTDSKNRLSGAEGYITARSSAAASTIWSLLTNKDYFGQPVVANDTDGNIDVLKTAGNLAGSKAPIPVSQGIKVAQGKEGLGEAALNTLGFRVTRDNSPVHSPSSPAKVATAPVERTGLLDEKGTPEARAAAKAKKAIHAEQLAAGARLGGSETLDAAQTRRDNATKNLPANISSQAKNILLRYATLNDNGKAKFNANPANRLALARAQYEDKKLSGKLNATEDYKAQLALGRESITSKYSKEVQDFYGLSKADQKAFFAADPDKAKELYAQAKQMDAELQSHKFSTGKYKYGLGGKGKKLKIASLSKPVRLSASQRVKLPKIKGTKSTARYAKVSAPKAGKKLSLTA